MDVLPMADAALLTGADKQALIGRLLQKSGNQLIEIKLQTSPTIDLGLHSPEDGADVVVASGTTFKSEDIRYVVFEGEVNHDKILLKYLYLVNGKDFTEAFPLFKGKGTNAKLQLPLPNNFFD